MKKSVEERLPSPAALIAALGILLALFIAKPFHVDDTPFLRIARHILAHPLAPYGFLYNWAGTPVPVWLFQLHPPLHPYLLAGTQLLTGEREVLLHAAFLVFPLTSAALMLSLARRWCSSPRLAVLLTVLTPAFLVSATNLSADMPLLTYWLLSVWLTVEALKRGRQVLLWPAGMAMTAAVMTKYFGAAAVPLLAFYWYAKKRSLGPHAAAFLLPLLALGAWCLYSRAQAGFMHPFASASFGVGSELAPLANAANTAAFLGGGLLWPVLLLPAAGRLGRRALLGSAAAAVVLAFAAPFGLAWWVLLQWALMAAGGVFLLAACADGLRRPDAEDLLLILWLAGTIAFAAFMNWTVNVRILLPALFPAAVLFVRWTGRAAGRRDLPRVLAGLTAVCAFAGSFVSAADAGMARAGKDFARDVVRPLVQEGRRVRFIGHWGFQHYMERAGAEPLDYRDPALEPGDIVAVSLNNTGARPLPERWSSRLRNLERTDVTAFGAATMDAEGGSAGFYSSLFGPVPYSFGPGRTLDSFLLQEYR